MEPLGALTLLGNYDMRALICKPSFKMESIVAALVSMIRLTSLHGRSFDQGVQGSSSSPVPKSH